MSSKVELDSISDINKEIERYLACLYESNELGNARISTTELSRLLKFHPSTVSNRLKSLSELKISNYRIIDYEKNYGAKLTYYGLIIGGKIVRKKRIKELFLKRLGMNIQEIDQQVDKIHLTEHISNLIKEQIIYPIGELNKEDRENIRCPHGALIPDESGKVRTELFYPLNYFPEGAELTIHRLSTNMDMLIRDEFYDKIQLHELFPGTKITWLETTNRSIILSKNELANKFKIKTKITDLIYCTDRNYDYIIP